LSRFNVFWIRDLAGTRAARAERVGVNPTAACSADRRPHIRERDVSRDHLDPGALHEHGGVMRVEPKLGSRRPAVRDQRRAHVER